MSKKKKEEFEHRSILGNIEIRADSNDESSKSLKGYAIRYNEQSQVLRDWWGDKFVEVIAEDAFSESMSNRDVLAFWNHNKDILLGNTRSNTLSLTSDAEGVSFDLDLPDSSWGENVFESAKRGDVSGVSFGFRVLDDVYSNIDIDGEEILKRTILKGELFEISPTHSPAYLTSELDVRSLNEYREEKRSTEADRLKLLVELL